MQLDSELCFVSFLQRTTCCCPRMVETPFCVTSDTQRDLIMQDRAWVGPKVNLLEVFRTDLEEVALHNCGFTYCVNSNQIWKVQRPTWPLRSSKVNLAEPKQMCGAAAVCFCTCSVDVSLGQDTTVVGFTWRYTSAWSRISLSRCTHL